MDSRNNKSSAETFSFHSLNITHVVSLSALLLNKELLTEEDNLEKRIKY